MEKKVFYVCSYGGSGSTMLTYALRRYGAARHIHSRRPPDALEFVGNERGGSCYEEWFNGVAVPPEELKNYRVIFIYRNPTFSIPSRFTNPKHLEHIQVDKTIKVEDVLAAKKDLYGVREFYDNYRRPNGKRNYKIYCVKYEEIFEKQDELSRILGIGPLRLVNKSTRKTGNRELDGIYRDLVREMDKNDFIEIS